MIKTKAETAIKAAPTSIRESVAEIKQRVQKGPLFYF